MTDAIIPRIWMPPLWEVGDGIIPTDGQCELDDVSYILATPEALASSPEVAALIREAEARGMEQIASELHQMAMMVPDYESSKILENRASALRAIAAPTRAAEETGT